MKRQICSSRIHWINVIGIIFCVVIFTSYLVDQIETLRTKEEMIRKNHFP